ncbi:MAG: hypothetical protein KAR20_28380, partial [Candidatus Heimdallarchaeota archaeon]|nr:hypothetical protein [Candidatus Heimdallarchaeota archaeon]
MVFVRMKIILILICLASGISTSQTDNNCSTAGCHEKLFTPANIHPAMEDDCTTCHESSNTDHPSGGKMDFTLSDIMPDLCFACHDENNTQKYLHAPIEFGECIDCHTPHSSDGDYLLKEVTVEATCSQCHDLHDEKGGFHEPVKTGYCTDCHSPHQSNNKSLLLEESPQLCFGCHGDLEISSEIKSVHPPFEEDCLNCHNPHISQMEFLLEEDLPELCFTCHDNPAEDEKMVTVHGAISEGKKCASCHSPHS